MYRSRGVPTISLVPVATLSAPRVPSRTRRTVFTSSLDKEEVSLETRQGHTFTRDLFVDDDEDEDEDEDEEDDDDDEMRAVL